MLPCFSAGGSIGDSLLQLLNIMGLIIWQTVVQCRFGYISKHKCKKLFAKSGKFEYEVFSCPQT
jgi:hypothetical protein